MPTLTIPSAPIAAPGTVPDTLRSFRVGVFPRRGKGFDAYTRDFCAEWQGCCVHGVSASSGKQAKSMAIQEHTERCMREDMTTEELLRAAAYERLFQTPEAEARTDTEEAERSDERRQ